MVRGAHSGPARPHELGYGAVAAGERRDGPTITGRLARLVLTVAAFAVVGVVASRSPAIAIGLVAGWTVLALGIAVPRFVVRSFLVTLTIVLVGYAFIGRPFAYLGYAPIFIGEIALGLGLASAVLNRDRWLVFRSPTAWTLLAFCLLGIVLLAEGLPRYGMMAARDAVIWGYAAFAFILVPLVLRLNLIEAVPRIYARVVPIFLIWVPIGTIIASMAGQLPTMPGSDVEVLSFKSGDLGVHLGGAGAFLLLGLHRSLPRPVSRILSTEWVWWLIWLGGFVLIGSINRGGMLAAGMGMLAALVLRGFSAIRRVIVIGTVAATALVGSLAFDLSLDVGRGRQISVRQIAVNSASLIGTSIARDAGGGLQGTKEWRLAWWGDIVGYTATGPYFWTGKGFGVNLADDDGYQIKSDGSVRSPHNGHMTILARMGVPGFALWVLLQVGFALSLLRVVLRAKARAQSHWMLLSAWVLSYWTALTVNTTFDVYLEGPQGGIWFWSIFGFGMAIVLAYNAAAAGPGTDWARAAPVAVPEQSTDHSLHMP